MTEKILRNALIAGLLLACAMPILTRAQSSGSQDSGQTQTAPAQNSASGPDLNLTDEQKSQFQQIHKDTEAQIKAIQDNSSLTAAQKEQQIRQLREEARKQEEALLTPEQKQILDKWRASHKGGSRK